MLSEPAIISYVKYMLIPTTTRDTMGPPIVQNLPVRKSPITLGIAQK